MLQSLCFSACKIVVLQFVKHKAAADPPHKIFNCCHIQIDFFQTTFVLLLFYILVEFVVPFALLSLAPNFHIFFIWSIIKALHLLGSALSPISSSFWGPKFSSSLKQSSFLLLQYTKLHSQIRNQGPLVHTEL